MNLVTQRGCWDSGFDCCCYCCAEHLSLGIIAQTNPQYSEPEVVDFGSGSDFGFDWVDFRSGSDFADSDSADLVDGSED